MQIYGLAVTSFVSAHVESEDPCALEQCNDQAHQNRTSAAYYARCRKWMRSH